MVRLSIKRGKGKREFFDFMKKKFLSAEMIPETKPLQNLRVMDQRGQNF